jgi:hypothetical protein
MFGLGRVVLLAAAFAYAQMGGRAPILSCARSRGARTRAFRASAGEPCASVRRAGERRARARARGGDASTSSGCTARLCRPLASRGRCSRRRRRKRERIRCKRENARERKRCACDRQAASNRHQATGARHVQSSSLTGVARCARGSCHTIGNTLAAKGWTFVRACESAERLSADLHPPASRSGTCQPRRRCSIVPRD